MFAIGLSLVPRVQNTIGAGFSGHDFKTVVGNVLSQLAVDEKVKNDILPLRLSRFSGFKEVKSSQMMLQQHTVLEYNHGINK